ncbi:hypothetical protein [Marmoricola sp. RAF53]|uniref:hypothetical protein n=1 Tax=Marmoricola sp. RAF53 TaxID=3233059 RepID=UPI003F9786B9
MVGAASITIERIEPVGPAGGISVTDFAVTQPGRQVEGFAARRLASLYGTSMTHEVVTPCARDGTIAGANLNDLSIELNKPAGTNATARGFEAVYRTRAGVRRVPIHFRINLCQSPLGSNDCVAPDE